MKREQKSIQASSTKKTNDIVTSSTIKKAQLKSSTTELRQLATLLHQAPAIMVMLKGPDHIFEIANANYLSLVGKKEEDVLGKPVKEAIPELVEQGFIEILDSVYQTGKPFIAKERLARVAHGKKGDLRDYYFNFIYQPIIGNEGEVEGIFGHAIDVTELVLARNRAESNEERYKTLFNSIDEGFVVIEMIFDEKKRPLDYRFLEANPMFEEQTGLKDALGKTARELLPDLEEHWFEIYGKVALTGEAVRFSEGSEVMGRWFDVYAFRLGGEGSNKVAILFTNITERKQFEQRKDDFISMASHELKTPVTSMKLFTQALLKQFEKDGEHESIRHLRKMDEQINKMTRLVRELLDVSRINAGKLEMVKAPFAIKDLVDDMVENFEATIPYYEFVLEGDVHEVVVGDRDRVGQVIINLYTNAMKYSPKGTKITTSIEKTGEMITICIKDQGIGIPKDHQEKIFDRFYQVTDPTEKTYPGLGMGLFISREIIKEHGGDMWVESKKGKGSTFCFTVPIAKEL